MRTHNILKLSIILLATFVFNFSTIQNAQAATCAISTNTTINQSYIDTNSCNNINITGTTTITWDGTTDLIGNGMVTIGDLAVVTFSGIMTLGETDNLTINDSASLTHVATNTTGLQLNVNQLILNGKIDVTSQGCTSARAGQGSALAVPYGPDVENNGECSTTGPGRGTNHGNRGGGAGHGGNGGAGPNGGGSAYGSANNPIYLGAGAGRGDWGRGGNGGGRIYINAETITFGDNGEIIANGQDGWREDSSSQDAGGGGAGGSIWIDTVEFIGIPKSISAHGGTVRAGSKASGGGGGGRIRIDYGIAEDWDVSSVTAADNTTGKAGSNGTVYGQNGSVYLVQKPTLSSPLNHSYNVSNSNLTLSTKPFSVTGETHASTTWEIYTDSARTNKVWHLDESTSQKTTVTLANGTFVGDLSGQNALAKNTKYYLKITFISSDDDTFVSSDLDFTTISQASLDGATKTWSFDNATHYTFNSTFASVNDSSDGLFKIKQVGGLYGGGYEISENYFSSKRVLQITNSEATNITDYQVRFEIPYDSDMQADFDDIRFIDSDGTTIIPYYLESKTDSTSAIVWIKTDLSASSTKSITMYYGNDSVASASNPDDVFIFFEDFESNTESWDTGDVNDSISTDRAKNGTYSFKNGATHAGWTIWDLEEVLNRTTDAYTVQAWFYQESGSGNRNHALRFYVEDSDTNAVHVNYSMHNNYYQLNRYNGSSHITQNRPGAAYNQWLLANLVIRNGSYYGQHKLENGTLKASVNRNDGNYSTFDAIATVGNGVFYMDDLLVRKWLNTEPTVEIQDEESAAGFQTVTIKSAEGVDFTDLYRFSDSLGENNEGKVFYQVGLDGDFYYFDGTSWTSATDINTHRNTTAELNGFLPLFINDVDTGKFTLKAIAISDGTEQVELDSVQLIYNDGKEVISVSNVTVDEDAGTATVTVAITGAPNGDATVQFATSNGTAIAGQDYTANSGTLTFSDGDDSSQTFTISITDDNIDEPNETITVTLSNASNATLGSSTADVTITDDDAQPTIAVADSTVSEDVGTATLNITLTGASSQTITANFNTANNSAQAGQHFVGTSGTVTWNPGQTGHKTVSVDITDDNIYNPNRAFILNTDSATNASINDNQGIITITNDDSIPAITVSDPTVTEGNVNANFTVTLSRASTQNVSVDYATANGTASSGPDYTSKSGTLTINAGQTTGTISVSTKEDTGAEGNENFVVNLSNPVNATISDNQGQATITDDDVPTFSIADASVDEDAGTVNVTVTMTGISESSANVDYATAGSTAISNTDFTAKSGTLTFTAGQTGNKTFTVNITDDSLNEASESFVVNLSNAVNAGITDSQASITINDEDPTPTVTLSTSTNSITEGGSGATLTATLSAVSGQNVTVNMGYSGVEDSDANKPSTITITAGNLTGTTTLTATDDDLDENTETIVASISSVTGANEQGTQQQSINLVDNDTAGITVTETSSSTEVTENGANDAYTVVLDSEPTDDVVVTLSDANGEVTLSVTELTFTSENWDTPQTVTVTAVDDDFDEDSHSDTISSSVASDDNNYNAFNISDISVSITDDDAAGYIIAKTGPDHRVVEGGATDTFTVVLNSAPVDDVVIDLTTTPSGQISTSPTSLTFTDENFDTPQTVTITATNDRVPESSLLAAVQLTPTTNDTDYDISIANQNVTVTDNDSAWVNITEADEDESASEDGDTKRYQFVLSSQPASPVSVRITTDSEVSSNVTLLSFHNQNAHAKAWNKPQIVTFTATDDDDIEGNHNAVIQFQVGGPNNYRNLPIPQLTIPIIDNDSNEVEEEEEVEQEEGPEGSPPPGEGSSTSGSSTNGSSTSGSSTSGSSTSGSSTNGSSTNGSSTNGSSTNGSSTNGSSTNGSSTNGSTTGNNRPERQIEITKLTAGSTQTVRPGARVKLRGRITKKPNGSHTAQWTQTSGPTVELSNIGALQPRFIAPSNFEGDSVTLGFKLTATTNADQKDATTSVIVRKKVDICLGNNCNNDDEKQVDPPKGPECNVIGMTRDGKAICEEDEVSTQCPAGTIESMSLGGQRICNPFRKPPKILPVGDLVAIGFPFYNRGQGQVILATSTDTFVLDPNNPNLADNPNVVVMSGSQQGDLFGHEIKMCDFNGDGQDDIYVTAPNTRKGTGYLIEITRDSNNALEAETVGVITGGQHPLRTKFMECLNYNGGSGDELFLPVKLEGNSSRNANSSLSFSVADSGADITEDGQLIFASESEVDDSNVAESTTAFNGLSDETINSASQIDLSVTDFTSLDTDVEIDAMSSGDLNADGYDDLVLASTETCDVYVYFGQENMESQISTYNEIACQEGSNFTDLVIGDVNGDGIDDLILVFPDDGGDGGSIYILPGVEDMSEDDMSGGQTIYGSPDNPITGLILADTDGDGDSELVINNGNGGTSIIGGDGSVLDTGSGGNTPTTLGGGGVSTGCSLQTQTSNSSPLWFLMIITGLGLLRLRSQKFLKQ